MEEEDLVLVGSSGLVIYGLNGTRGKLFLSHSLLLSAGSEGLLSSKVNITTFSTFSSKTTSSLAPPVATVFWAKIHLPETLRPIPHILLWQSL